ncbi:MAG: acyl-protein synthetase [Arcobacter sp.]|nr:MAG: acyl-protein synthetase [Arcobacter sp.]
MFKIEKLFDDLSFSLKKNDKELLYSEALIELTKHHYSNCVEYRKILDVLEYDINIEHTRKDIPSLPVRLFKEYNLHSVDKEEIIKTMTSSGTSGQKVSKIYLDKSTASNQTKVLAKILSEFIGKKRLPMLVIDTESILKDRNNFSARAAGVLGFSMFGFNITYALDVNMEIDYPKIEKFLEKHKGKDILVFGFTSIIWEHFHKPLLNDSTNSINIEKGILIHGGGWKKLENEAVDSITFRNMILKSSGIKKIHNYYGMVEQTGSIFMECEEGYLHCSDYSDIEIIDNNFKTCDYGKKGLVKLYSLLPYSYPGHIILTEDSGEIIGEDDCICGRVGKYFKIHGRVKNAEIRGCSDTYKS